MEQTQTMEPQVGENQLQAPNNLQQAQSNSQSNGGYEPPFKIASVTAQTNEQGQQDLATPPAPVVDEKAVLQARLEELEAKLQSAPSEPQVKYQVPEELKALIENPQTLAILNENIADKPLATLVMEQFWQENPWATSESMIREGLRRQYPDIDFDIPENLGLSDVEFAQLEWKGEAYRKQQMDEQAQLRGQLEQAMNIEQPAPIDNEAINAEWAARVDNGLNGYKPTDLALNIPGYEFPKLDLAKVQELAYSENAPLMVDPNTGFVWPNMEATAALAELAHLKAQIPAMLEAAKRAAPREAVQAINQTLNNQSPLANSMNQTFSSQNGQSGPRIGGMRIVGVSKDF